FTNKAARCPGAGRMEHFRGDWQGPEGELAHMRKAARRWTVRTAFIAFVVAAASVITAATAFADASAQPAGITDEAGDMHDLYLLLPAIALVVCFAAEGALLLL